MAIANQYRAPLIPQGCYHIYNRTNNKEKLFLDDENRNFFFHRYCKYISPYVETYSYALLDTHFHLLLKVHPQTMILKHISEIPKKDLTKKESELLLNSPEDPWENHFMEWQFLRFFTSYSMAYNQTNNRAGNLFHKPFKRVEINRDSQFSHAVFYIHANPVKHNLSKDIQSCPWTSYQSLISDKPTLLERKYVLDWFGGRDAFMQQHQDMNPFFGGYSLFKD